MRIEVSNDIPPPVPMKRAIAALEPGQSCLIEADGVIDRLRSARATASRIASETNRSFTVRMTDDGVRVWRLS